MHNMFPKGWSLLLYCEMKKSHKYTLCKLFSFLVAIELKLLITVRQLVWLFKVSISFSISNLFLVAR